MVVHGERIFGKDERLKEFICYQCLTQDSNPLDHPDNYPCCICKDRPNRNKDKSEFVPDFTDEERKRQSEEHKAEEEREGKYNY